MTLIEIDPVGTTTLLCATSTIEETVNDKDTASTTVLSLSTTLSSSSAHTSSHMHVNMADKYLSSLSNEQIAQLCEMIDEKSKETLNLKLDQDGNLIIDEALLLSTHSNSQNVENLGKGPRVKSIQKM